jgi:hypothetical protein
MARKIWQKACNRTGVAEERTAMSNEATNSAQEMSECRALVPLSLVRSRPAERPHAAFVMQLIACERRLGAYKAARRAPSADAATLYASRIEAPSRSLQRVV